MQRAKRKKRNDESAVATGARMTGPARHPTAPSHSQRMLPGNKAYAMISQPPLLAYDAQKGKTR